MVYNQEYCTCPTWSVFVAMFHREVSHHMKLRNLDDLGQRGGQVKVKNKPRRGYIQ